MSGPTSSVPPLTRRNRIERSLIRILEKLSGLSRRTKQIAVALIDFAMLIAATWVAYSLRMDQWALWPEPVQVMLAVSLLLAPPIFVYFGIYRTIFRFAGIGMLVTLVRAFIVYGGLIFAVFTLFGIDGVPRTLGILQPIFFFVFVCLVRILIRYSITDVLRRGQYGGSRRRSLIYGAGLAGQQLANSLRAEPSTKVVGFVDDDDGLINHRLDGLPVIARRSLPEAISRLGIDDILLAMPSASRRRRRRIVQDLASAKVTVRSLPGTLDLIDGNVSIDDIRPLQIEDLLGRDPISPDQDLLTRTIRQRCVMVSGAGGSIGSELCRQIVDIGASKLLLFEISEISLYQIERELRARKGAEDCEIVPILGSVRDRMKLQAVFERYAIDTVFHAAAYKHVPLVEANPLEGIRNNIGGTYEIVRAADQAGVKDFILISTDKAVRPTNVMGATKRGAEQVLQSFAERSAATRFSMVRFGNVLGSSGSVVPLFDRQIREGGPITLTDRRVTRYFMTIPEAANLVIQAAGMAVGGEVFVLDMGKPVLIADLARTMVQLSGLTVRDQTRPDGDIEIVEVGLRPGEKLYEELLIGDSPSRTGHERIRKANEHYLDKDAITSITRQLISCADREEALALLKQLVPEFVHRRDN